jgi:hypothetical protein
MLLRTLAFTAGLAATPPMAIGAALAVWLAMTAVALVAVTSPALREPKCGEGLHRGRVCFETRPKGAPKHEVNR